MEKKLLLLGVLREHEMHGYQLNEVLGHELGLPVRLTKSNAYKLLSKMEADGWVIHKSEQVGNRPARRVYSVTPAGEEAFQTMVRESLATYTVPEFPSTVALYFLDMLPPEELHELLLHRRKMAQANLDQLDELSAEVRETHPSVEYLYRFLIGELEWVDGLIAQRT